jgi:DNA-directed RNA polymerase specialized sigma24 family protein
MPIAVRPIARGRKREEFHPDLVTAPIDDEKILARDTALNRLAVDHPAKARLVELRFFAGLTGDEAANVLGISPSRADRDWVFAHAWLRREMNLNENADTNAS